MDLEDNMILDLEWAVYPDRRLNLLNLYLSLIDLLLGKRPRIDVLREYSDVDKILFIYLDGVGYEPFIDTVNSSFKERTLKITSIYPATTASVLTSLATGKSPENHGVLEWNLYIPEIDALVEPLLMRFFHHKCNDILCDEGISPSLIIRSKRLYRKLIRNGIEVAVFLRSYISKSCYTKYILEGAGIHPYINITDLSLSISKELKRSHGKTLYFIYIEGTDSIGHLYGYNTPQYLLDLKYTMKILIENLKSIEYKPKDTLVIFTSDHGMTNASKENIVYLDKKFKDIKKWIRRDKYGIPLISGSPRNVYIHVIEGYLDKMYRKLESLSNFSLVIKREELSRINLLRRVDEPILNRIGDIIVLPKPGYSVWIKHYKAERIEITGMHGGVSSEEMYIPFLYGSFNEILNIN